MLLAIDPGRSKMGIAIYDSEEESIVYRKIILTDDFIQKFINLTNRYFIDTIIIGDGTFSEKIFQQIREEELEVEIKIIDESYSTLDARRLYFKVHPPRGLRRLLPISMQTPLEPVDDLVAVILLGRYLGEMPKIY